MASPALFPRGMVRAKQPSFQSNSPGPSHDLCKNGRPIGWLSTWWDCLLELVKKFLVLTRTHEVMIPVKVGRGVQVCDGHKPTLQSKPLKGGYTRDYMRLLRGLLRGILGV